MAAHARPTQCRAQLTRLLRPWREWDAARNTLDMLTDAQPVT